MLAFSLKFQLEHQIKHSQDCKTTSKFIHMDRNLPLQGATLHLIVHPSTPSAHGTPQGLPSITCPTIPALKTQLVRFTKHQSQ